MEHNLVLNTIFVDDGLQSWMKSIGFIPLIRMNSTHDMKYDLPWICCMLIILP